MVKRILVKTLILAAILAPAGILLAQGSGTPSNLRVLTDANNYLLVSAAAQTNPISNPTVFTNTRLRTDASGSLVVVLTGSVTPSFPIPIPASTCAAPSLSLSGGATTGIAFTATPSILTCVSGNAELTVEAGAVRILSNSFLSFGNSTVVRTEGSGYLIQRNGTNAQRLSVANTYTSSTNNELFSIDWQTTANVALVGTRTAATGTGRRVFFAAQSNSGTADYAGFSIIRTSAPLVRVGVYQADGTTPIETGTAELVRLGEFTNAATSGTITPVTIRPTYNQTSGTAANTDLLINRTQTAIGSGTQNLLDAQVSGSSQFAVRNTGVLVADGNEGQTATCAAGIDAITVTNGVVTAITCTP